MINTNSSLHKLLNELLEDCALFGTDYECFAYFDKQSGLLKDYSLVEEKTLYFDERCEKQSLFKTLAIFVYYDLYSRNVFSAGAVLLVTIRNLSGLSQSAFARKLEIPVKTYQNYEYGRRAVLLDLLLKARSVLEKPLNYVTFFRMYEDLKLALKDKEQN